MTYQPTSLAGASKSLPKLPSWVTSGAAETPHTVAFRSGAALLVLDGLVSDPRHSVPVKLFANRLALSAARTTSKLEGRLAREADIRDAYYLTPAGEARGPDGDLLAFWRDAAQLRMTGKDWQSNLMEQVGPAFADDVLRWVASGADRSRTHGPLVGCTLVMRTALEADDRAERTACMLSDIVLARALNWKSILPVTARQLTKAMLRELTNEGQGADLRIQTSLLISIEDTIRLARDLATRAAALRAVTPKLRAKGSKAAADLFLSEDAIGPSMMLSPTIQGTTIPMTDRAARRFCDRLVELGVVHELTGRSTFRLYGIGP